MMLDLFDSIADAGTQREELGSGALVLRGAALSRARSLLAAVDHVTAQSPFRLMTTPGGYRMSVAMSNCGSAGWVTDRRGYRYDAIDPSNGRPWPAMPAVFLELASVVAGDAIRVGPAAKQAEDVGERIPAHRQRAEAERDRVDVRERQDKKRHPAQLIGGTWRNQTARSSSLA